MARPTFLVVEPEPGHALSTRKLVLESAKFNVITAHSWKEAEELFCRFPKIDAVIVTHEIDDLPCTEYVRALKQTNPHTVVVVLAPNISFECQPADHHIATHSPQELVELLRSRFGDPQPG